MVLYSLLSFVVFETFVVNLIEHGCWIFNSVVNLFEPNDSCVVLVCNICKIDFSNLSYSCYFLCLCFVNRMEESSGSGCGRGKNKRFWSSEEDNALVAALSELATDPHWKCDNGFRNGYMNRLEEVVNKSIPGCGLKAVPHIESRLKTLGTKFRAIIQILNLSGVKWDDERHMISMERSVYDEYCKVISFIHLYCYLYLSFTHQIEYLSDIIFYFFFYLRLIQIAKTCMVILSLTLKLSPRFMAKIMQPEKRLKVLLRLLRTWKKLLPNKFCLNQVMMMTRLVVVKLKRRNLLVHRRR